MNLVMMAEEKKVTTTTKKTGVEQRVYQYTE